MTRIYINLSALSFTHCTTVVYCCRLYTWSACCGKMSTKDHKETNSQYKYFRLARLIHLIYIIPPHPSPQPEKKISYIYFLTRTILVSLHTIEIYCTGNIQRDGLTLVWNNSEGTQKSGTSRGVEPQSF